MNQWRPPRRIRVLALGLLWREGRLLVCEVRDDAGRLKGVRPPGGGVEFGETWRAALVREFREEFGLDVAVAGEPHVAENIFTHEGARGHEIAFVAPVEIVAGALAAGESVLFLEDRGQPVVARWLDPATLDADGAPLFSPTG
ncbi:MAG: NUDIX domain-containing protein [Rhodoblastus sp.]|nr:MAG: NUDIX domain-containing protein [Rhodoblastus sp.]